MPPRQTYFISVNSSMPYFDPSRPSPDSLTPPNGASAVEMSPVLTPTMPYSSASATRKTRAARAEFAPQDEPLWEALRECRKQLAVEHNVPPYVIFHDATLREMVAVRPADSEALLAVGGVGQAKLARYGERFLEVLRRHSPAV